MNQTGYWQVEEPLWQAPRLDYSCPPLERFVHGLLDSGLVAKQELDQFLSDRPGLREDDTQALAHALVAQGVLNDFQVQRVLSGQPHGLVLGNYRVTGWLGSGGMGVVYKAEHVHMKRPVALKVLTPEADDNAMYLERFTSEMQALAGLRHPNIVQAFDAGQTPAPGGKVMHYLVMEFVEGVDLERHVQDRGPLPLAVACDYARQAANGLRHAHEHGLVHRDIKPSNLLITGLEALGKGGSGAGSPYGQLKILDFGLARLYRRRCTEAHVVLGTIDYMAPEQARDARSVDVRADIYSLGGTLYWMLTGQRPFPSDRPAVEELLARQYEKPVLMRNLRDDIPLELEALVSQMMALDPNDRYPTPLAVITALNEFLEPSHRPGGGPGSGMPPWSHPLPTHAGISSATDSDQHDAREAGHGRRVLLVTSRAGCRTACRALFEKHGLACAEANLAAEVPGVLEGFPADVILIDGRLDDESGVDLCRRLRAEGRFPHLKLLLLTGAEDGDEGSPDAEVVFDDHAPRDSSEKTLLARVRLALRLKESEERTDRLTGWMMTTNGQLEQAMQQRDHTVYQAQDVLIFAMAKMAELRGQETQGHLLRMQKYARVLSEAVRTLPAFAPAVDDAWVRMLERCVLLHDIGKVAIPDHILMKPGKLDPEERSIMESHTVLGANILDAVARQHGACLAFLQMAIDVVRHHHEQYDGSGYPDGLVGDAIPLAARIVAIGDVYDAMRSKLVYKPGLAHAAVRRLMLNPGQTQFDPALLVAFRQCEGAFEQVFAQTTD